MLISQREVFVFIVCFLIAVYAIWTNKWNWLWVGLPGMLAAGISMGMRFLSAL